jgi:cytochrome P450
VGKDGAVIAGKYVPGGMKVSVKQWVAHRSATNFTDPDVFEPARWLGDEKYAGDKRRVVQPFSYGPRNCLGRK